MIWKTRKHALAWLGEMAAGAADTPSEHRELDRCIEFLREGLIEDDEEDGSESDDD